MFELNGDEYSLSQLVAAADKYNNGNFDGYMEDMYKKGLIKKQAGSTEDPTVGQNNTGLDLEDGSSESVSWFDQTWLGRGIAAASTTGEATSLMSENFSNISKESINDFIKAKEQEARSHVPSERMDKFQKQYIKEGKTWSAFFRGVRNQPGLLPELFVQSIGTQLGALIDSPGASLAAAGTGTAVGASIGAVPGAVAGFMGGLATSMEAALTFGELIETRLKEKNQEFTDENIKALLESEGTDIRNKALGRGLTIGAIEGFSGGLAGKVAVATKQTVKGLKRSTLAAGGAGVLVEAAGGATGEVLGRAVAGQEMDAAEIGFEAITGTVTAPINVTTALLTAKKPTYKLNGEKITYEQMKDFVDTADPVDIARADIKMADDYTGLGEKATQKQEIARKQVNLSGDTDAIADVAEGFIENKIKTTIALAKQGKQIGSIKDAFAVENNEDAVKAYKELQDQYGKDIIGDQDVTDADGFFVPTPDGNVIIINKAVAKETGQINVGGHELLHGVVQKHYENLGTQGKIDFIEGFKSTISKESLKYIQDIIDARNKDRVDGKTGKTIKGEDIKSYSDEYLTIYSDGIVKEKITYDESLFTKFKNFLQDVFRKFGYNKEFGSGTATYNFMRDYNDTIKKSNEISKRALAVAGDTSIGSGGKFSKTITDAVDRLGKVDKDGNNLAEKGTGNFLYQAEADDVVKEIKEKGYLDNLIAAKYKADKVPKNFVGDVITALTTDIKAFKPEQNNSLFGYLQGRITFRAGDVYNKIYKQKEENKGSRDVGETTKEGDVKIQVAAETTSEMKQLEEKDMSIQAQIQEKADKQKTKQQAESKFRKVLGLETGGVLYMKVLDAARKSLLRAYSTKDTVRQIQRNLRDQANTYLFKDVKNLLGTNKYEANLRQYREVIMESLFVSDLVQMERETLQDDRVFTEFVKKLTTRQEVEDAVNQNLLPPSAINTYNKDKSVNLYKKGNPTEKQFLAYFMIPAINPVTGLRSGKKGTRKDTLAKNIAGALAYDATIEVAQEPEVAQMRADLAEARGESLLTDNIEQLAAAIGRNPNVKFSKSDADVGISILEGKSKDDGYGGKKWQKYIDNPDISNRTKYEVTDEYLKRSSEQNDAISDKELAKLDYFKNGKRRKTKIRTYKKYEIIAKQRAEKVIKDLGLKKEGYVVENLSEKDNNPDIRITRNGKTVLAIEIKGNTARGVSVSFNYKKDGKGLAKGKLAGQKQETENYNKKEKSLIKDSNKVFEEMIDFVGEDQMQYSSRGNLQISVDGVKKIKEKGIHLKIYKNKYFITTKDVANSYAQKKGKDGSSRTSHIIEMGNAGMFNMDNSAELSIEGLQNFSDQKTLIPLTARINFGAVNKAGTHRTASIRVEPQLNSMFFDKQAVSLINKKGNKNIKFKYSKSQQVSVSQDIIKAVNNSRTLSKFSKSKGASIFDFDETVGISENFIIAKKGDITQKIPSYEWPLVGETLKEQGYEFDFTDFNKVTKGKPGPLMQKMKNQIEKYGSENVFILTARAPESQTAIHEWLESEGVNIPVDNITGLGNSTGEAKAAWVLDKYANKGYNDIYFVDDALQNVKAVKNMLDQLDIKGKSVQAKIKFSKSMDNKFNSILEDVTGIESQKRFAAIKGRKRGEGKGKFRFFIPPSHEDFVGLLYNFLGKGKKGDAHRDFFEQALVRPLNRANREYDTARQSIANDFKALNKQFPNIKSKLPTKTPDGDFTYQDAVRIYLWNKHGYDIPGLSEIDLANLVELVTSDTELQAYAENINVISKQETYVKPTDGWNSGDLRVDLDDATGRVGREQYFAEFIENVDVIFSEENLNKIEAGYGKGVRSALEDILYRIKTGKNRPTGQNEQVNKLMNYLNGSVGTVMFFNMRSALLQQMSIVNYINFADNNMFAAAKAFANQKQYWADWSFIFNSDMLKQRRGGIQTDVNGAELAASLRNSKDITRKLISKLLELGFLPTQIGDNIAIATGGASYYRNRINTYLKEGLKQKEAEAKAFTDFQDITQSTQQSARPDMVSQQQASVIGKVILNFQNVTSQFNRLGKKAFQDIYNRRTTKPNTTQMQSDISNASRITYYFAVQNLIFYTLQTALFAMMFDDDEEDVNNLFLKKKERLINGSIDSVLRGSGLIGGIVATLKNVAIAFARQRDVNYNPDESAVAMEALNLSPVLGIKLRKIVNAEKTLNYNKKVIKEMETFDIDNPQWSAVTGYTESLTNIPLNRLYNKTQNVRQALNNEHSAWERSLMFLGWSQYNLNLENKKMDAIKAKTKNKKRNTGRRIITRKTITR